MLRHFFIFLRANMVVMYPRVLFFLYLSRLGLSFVKNQDATKYVAMANTLPDIPNLKCSCAEDTCMCNCDYVDGDYIIEAPFLAMLKDPTPASLAWPPSPPYIFLPAVLHPRLRILKAEALPLPEVKLWPRPFEEIRARYKLMFKALNIISPPIILNYDMAAWPLALPYSPEKLYVVIHGWVGSDLDYPIQSMQTYLMLRNQYPHSALISVNWNKAATGSYRQSAADTLVIGREVGYLLYLLVESKRIKAEDIHLIGVDMGSHVAKRAAVVYNDLSKGYNVAKTGEAIGEQLGRRTGLNPLAKYFGAVDEIPMIHDAKFVDIIHTSSILHDLDETKNTLSRFYGLTTLDANNNFKRTQVDFYPTFRDFATDCPEEQYGCTLYLAVKIFKATLRDNYYYWSFLTRSRFDGMAVDTDVKGKPVPIMLGRMGIGALGNGNQFVRNFSIPQNLLSSDVQKLAKSLACTEGPATIPRHAESNANCGEAGMLTHRIYQGIPAAHSEFPWLVCILQPRIGYIGENADVDGNIWDEKFLRSETDELPFPDLLRITKRYVQTCTGSLLESNWVVTAAHCFDFVKNLVPIYLVFGAKDCYTPPDKIKNVRRVIVEKQQIATQTVFIHESFPEAALPIEDSPGDIALIRLSEPVILSRTDNIYPICYREAESYQYEDCWRLQLAGYGGKGRDEKGSYLSWMRANLIHLDNPRHSLVNSPDYGVEFGELTNRLPETFAFGNFEDNRREGFTTGRSSCPGDSGAPIMEYGLGADKRATLVGVLSAGPRASRCAEASQRLQRKELDPTYVEADSDGVVWRRQLSTAVKLKPYLNWIKDKMAGTYLAQIDVKFNDPLSKSQLVKGPKFLDSLSDVYPPRPSNVSWYNFRKL